jgi:hypothetical protein
MSNQTPRQGDSPPPSWPSASFGTDRVRHLGGWVEQHRTTFTAAALEKAAIDAGYTREEFGEALAEAAAGEAAKNLKPLRSRARFVVLAGYAIVWGLFATAFLTRDYMYGIGPLALTILTVFLGCALFVSWLWLGARHPDPTDVNRAMAVLLSLPVVLLLVVGGLCLPFVPGS